MEFRSTNDNGWVHFQGDLISNVSSGQAINSSHGVHLTGGSTGGIVQPAGDETNIALNVRGKGSGLVNLGTASQTLQLTSTAVTTPAGLSLGTATQPFFLNSTTATLGSRSTTAIAYMQRYRVDFTVPALSSNGAAGSYAESSLTTAGVTTGALYFLTQQKPYNSTYQVMINVRCSTLGSVNFGYTNFGVSTLTGSTMSAQLFQIGF